MTSRNILDAMGGISPDMIAEAAPGAVQRKRGRRTRMKWWTAVAACLCLAVAIGIAVSPRIYHEYFYNGDQTIVDELYPFDSIRVGESTAFDSVYGGGISGAVTYDALDDTSFSFTVTVNEANEYAHDLILNYYIEFEVNGEYVADKGERIPAYPLLDVYVNGIQQDGYDFGFMRETGIYCVTVDFTRLLEAEGRAVLCDFVFPNLVAFEVYHFEESYSFAHKP